MAELYQCDMLVDLFTKYSSHLCVTKIRTTQNVFDHQKWQKACLRKCYSLQEHTKE